MNLPAPCFYLIGALIATMALSQCTPALGVSTKPISVEIPLSAKPITTQSLSRYAAQARKSNGPVLAGRIKKGAQPAHGLFSCVVTDYPRPHGMAEWEAARLAGFLSFRSANPFSHAAQIAERGMASSIKKGA